MKNAEAICEAIYPNRFHFANEKDLQDCIAKILTARGVEFEREAQISPWDRLDFLTSDGLAIEVKVDGSLAGVTRQLWRYSQKSNITHLILVTDGKRIHQTPGREVSGG